MTDLPRALEVARLASARAPELGALAAALVSSRSPAAWGDAAVPAHARRRATSHAGRGRRTFRANAERAAAAGRGAPPLPESRAMRRAAGRLAAGAAASAATWDCPCAGAGGPALVPTPTPPRRLETHVWHAKRLAMSGKGGGGLPGGGGTPTPSLWGHALPTGAVGAGRGDRAARRRLAKGGGGGGGGGALVHDASYWVALQVVSPSREALAACLDAATGGRAWRGAARGAGLVPAGEGGGGEGEGLGAPPPAPPAAFPREVGLILREPVAAGGGGPPAGRPLGPAADLAVPLAAVGAAPRPPPGGGRPGAACALWLWVHPATLPSARPALEAAAAASPGVTVLPGIAPVRRVEVAGRGADAAVGAVVRGCVVEGGNGSGPAATVASSLPASASRLPDGAVLALTLRDPRLARPLAEARWAVRVEEGGGGGGRTQGQPAACGGEVIEGGGGGGGGGASTSAPLPPWPGAGCPPPLTEAAVSATRAAQRAALAGLPGAAPPQPPPSHPSSPSSPTTPALLVRRAPASGLPSGDAFRCDGGRGARALPTWSLIVPAGWVLPVWGALLPARPTSSSARPASPPRRCRPAGQAEWAAAAAVQGTPWFPHDWPDTEAGRAAAAGEVEADEEADRRRPPGRRQVGGGGRPVRWGRWADLPGGGPAPTPPTAAPPAWPTSLFVARTPDDLRAARAAGAGAAWHPACLVPVRVAASGPGTPLPGDAVWIGGALAGFITTACPRGGQAGSGGLALAGRLWAGERVPPPRCGRRHKKGGGRPATLHAAVEVRPGDGSGRSAFAGAAVPVHGPVGVAWMKEQTRA